MLVPCEGDIAYTRTYKTLSDIFLKEYHALSKEYRIKGFCIEIVRNNKVPGTLPIPTSLKRTSHMLKERLASRHGVWQFSCFVFFSIFFVESGRKWPKPRENNRRHPQTKQHGLKALTRDSPLNLRVLKTFFSSRFLRLLWVSLNRNDRGCVEWWQCTPSKRNGIHGWMDLAASWRDARIIFFRDGHFECPLNRAKSCEIVHPAGAGSSVACVLWKLFFAGLYRM